MSNTETLYTVHYEAPCCCANSEDYSRGFYRTKEDAERRATRLFGFIGSKTSTGTLVRTKTVSIVPLEVEKLPKGRFRFNKRAYGLDRIFSVDDNGELEWNPSNKDQPRIVNKQDVTDYLDNV